MRNGDVAFALSILLCVSFVNKFSGGLNRATAQGKPGLARGNLRAGGAAQVESACCTGDDGAHFGGNVVRFRAHQERMSYCQGHRDLMDVGQESHKKDTLP